MMNENNQKKIALIAIVLTLLALSGTASTVSSFFVNVLGQPQINESVTFIPGDNIVLSQDINNKTITIMSNASSISNQTSFDTIKVNTISKNTSSYINFTDSIKFENDYKGIFSQNGLAYILFESITSRIFMWSEKKDEPDNHSYISLNSDVVEIHTELNMNESFVTLNPNSLHIAFGSNDEYVFDKDKLDMKNNNITNNPQITSLQNEKVNKSGDNMTGYFSITSGTQTSGLKINSSLTGVQANIFGLDIITQGVYGLKINNPINGSGGGAGIQVISGDILPDGSSDIDIANGDRLGFMLFKGTFNSTPLNGGVTLGAGFLSYATENYTSTTQGADLRFVTTIKGTTNRVTNILLNGTETTLPFLAGSGNDYVCVDSTGKLFRSNTAC